METHRNNRMQKASTPSWSPAKVEMVQPPPERVILCVQCGSNRTKTRITRPEAGVSQMECQKCGGKFAVRNIASHFPESRPLSR